MANTNMRRFIAAAAGVLCLALCLALVYSLASAPKDARQAIEMAASATVNERARRLDAARESIPALLPPSFAGGAKSDLTLAFLSISGIDDAQRATALLTGTAVNVGVLTSGDSMELTADMSLFGRKPLDFYGFFSPGLVALGIPEFSDAVVGFSPETVFQDLYDIGLIDENMLESMTALYPGEHPLRSKADAEAAIRDVFLRLAELAEYEYAGAKDGADIYTMTLSGESVNDAVRELFARLYSMMGESYARFDPLAQFGGAPEHITLTLEVVDGALRAFECAPAPDGESAAIWARGEMTDSGFVLDFGLDLGEVSLNAALTETIDTDRYALGLRMSFDDGYIGPQSLTIDFEAGSDGDYSLEADLSGSLTFDMTGEAHNRGGTVSGQANITLKIDDRYTFGAPVTLAFSLKHSAAAYSGTLVPREYTTISELGADGLMTLAQQYFEAFERMIYSYSH